MNRRLIVNADDLGQSPGVNRGIARAVDQGIVTSASLMVRWPAAEAAARWASTRPAVSIGLHLDFGEWAYRDGTWVPLYEVIDTADADAVDREMSRQLGMFLRLVGRDPTHLNSHQHTHHSDPLRAMLLSTGARLGVPVRELNEKISYCGRFYGQSGKGDPYPEGITLDSLLAILEGLPAGTTELGCHPGDDDLDDLDSMYTAERATERSVLCDPGLPAALARRGIELCAFG